MPVVIPALLSRTNHVFVDFENVHQIDLTIIGSKSVSFTLLAGPKQTRLDAALVEKLFEHAAAVQLVRLTESGRNALDFAVAYYLGRAAAFDSSGSFHVVSKDTGFDPLIAHLRSKHVDVHRHDSFATLPFAVPAPARQSAPAPIVRATGPKVKAKAKSKSPSKLKTRPLVPDEQAIRVVEHLRKPTATHPKNKKKLVSYLVAYLGHKITEADALNLIENLSQSRHLTITEKGTVTYHLEPK